MSARSKAHDLGAERNQWLTKASQAFQTNQVAEAKKYSLRAQQLNVEMAAASQSATQQIITQRMQAIRQQVLAGSGYGGDAGDDAGRGIRGRMMGAGLGVCLGIARKAGANSTLDLGERTEVAIDLHGLHGSEACDIVEEFLMGLEKEGFRGLAYLIAGTERHTGSAHYGASKTRVAASVKSWLGEWQYHFAEINGTLIVDPLVHA